MELYTFFAKDSSKTESQMKLSYNRRFHLIECFHSRGQHLCKFIGTKESVCIRKEFNSHRTGLGHQHGRRFIVLGHQYGHRDVMCKQSIVGFHMTSLNFKLKKLSILPRFYFHDALQQLKSNFHTNLRFKRVLGFVIEYA